MKNLIKIAACFVTLSIGIIACSKDEIIPSDPQNATRSIGSTEFLTKGMWRISSFQWHDRENNAHFAGYKFRFSPSGVVTATSGNMMFQGKWAQGENFIFLNFGVMKPVNELNNKHWFVSGFSDGTLSLRGLSPYDNSSEYLVFEKTAPVSTR